VPVRRVKSIAPLKEAAGRSRGRPHSSAAQPRAQTTALAFNDKVFNIGHDRAVQAAAVVRTPGPSCLTLLIPTKCFNSSLKYATTTSTRSLQFTTHNHLLLSFDAKKFIQNVTRCSSGTVNTIRE